MSREQEKLCQPYHTPLYPLEVGYFFFFFTALSMEYVGLVFLEGLGALGPGPRSSQQ